MSTAPYSAYKVTATTTADPITLTTMLFDGGVKAIKKARLQSESGNRKGFLREVERAYLIVGELLATLDLSQGELPKTLSGIYAYCMRCITESTLGDLSKLDEAEKHITRIAGAWKQATGSLRAESQNPRSTSAAA
ncbi:MAG: flagellar export chaperone FliS [Tepidiformaceae bacterium]